MRKNYSKLIEKTVNAFGKAQSLADDIANIAVDFIDYDTDVSCTIDSDGTVSIFFSAIDEYDDELNFIIPVEKFFKKVEENDFNKLSIRVLKSIDVV